MTAVIMDAKIGSFARLASPKAAHSVPKVSPSVSLSSRRTVCRGSMGKTGSGLLYKKMESFKNDYMTKPAENRRITKLSGGFLLVLKSETGSFKLANRELFGPALLARRR
ncbi:hypothetical protein ACHHV8_13735 [Paenibacillus sp. TAB 01]|uniref:hypothetical protein n=1 Tax=Paenibacillus sp. TAB 01 TaxID=3368988 RepID=UPI0037534E75